MRNIAICSEEFVESAVPWLRLNANFMVKRARPESATAKCYFSDKAFAKVQKLNMRFRRKPRRK